MLNACDLNDKIKSASDVILKRRGPSLCSSLFACQYAVVDNLQESWIVIIINTSDGIGNALLARKTKYSDRHSRRVKTSTHYSCSTSIATGLLFNTLVMIMALWMVSLVTLSINEVAFAYLIRVHPPTHRAVTSFCPHSIHRHPLPTHST